MAAAAVVVCLVVTTSKGVADRRDYLGSEACGVCHKRELAIWRRGPHARAGAGLGGRRNASCLRCHTTGDAPTGPVVERFVGCEACHGPGAGYGHRDIMRNPPLARALGLRSLASPEARGTTCSLCHAGVETSLRPIELDLAWTRIGHFGGKR